MNTGVSWPDRDMAWVRILKIQTKLHQWATDAPDRRFDDLYNLVYDPAVLVTAWERVKGNRGARSAGVDGQTAFYVSAVRGVEGFLDDLRADLKARSFQPLPVRERMIPKSGGKLRRLGIPTVRDRVAQAALKLVLEPIFEADFRASSYGFRPNRSRSRRVPARPAQLTPRDSRAPPLARLLSALHAPTARVEWQ